MALSKSTNPDWQCVKDQSPVHLKLANTRLRFLKLLIALRCLIYIFHNQINIAKIPEKKLSLECGTTISIYSVSFLLCNKLPQI